jgi:hypothetical protein
MNKSDSIELLSKALVKAQAEMPAVKFDAENPFFKSHYATLGSIIEVTRPILAEYGLSVTQLVNGGISVAGDQIAVGVETILIHESGQWIGNQIVLPVEDKNKSQASGAIITYLRRYSLAAILGIYSDEDDDGNSSKTEVKTAKVEKPVAFPRNVNDAADIIGSDGTRYGDCTDEDLRKKLIGINKGLMKDPKDANLQAKKAAAEMILNSRAK